MQDLKPPRRHKTTAIRRLRTRKRRDRLSQLQPDGARLRCINENKQGTHGPPTCGCRCDVCHETYTRSQ